MRRSPTTSDDCERGRRDGLRAALAILAAEEARWEATLGGSGAWRTNLVRAARHQAYRVAHRRVLTALNRLLPGREADDLPVELASMINRAGL